MKSKISINGCLKFDYDKFNEKQLFKILLKFDDTRKLRILYISTYDPNYTRTESLLDLFKRQKLKYKKILVGNSKLKYFKAIYNLIKHQQDFDVIFIGFRGQEILPFIKFFTKKPIIFDAFISVYDTLCFDRKKFRSNSIIGKFLKWYDSYLCNISDIVLVDTKTHKKYFEKEFNAKNINFLYLGCNKKLFRPMKTKKNKNKFIVFWYGKANPLQGVNIILKSADIIRDNANILFKIVGPVRKKYIKLIKKLNLKNVEFINYIPYKELPMEINKSDLCLGGHFSNINKAKGVIAGKTYQFLACRKPTIVGDNSANRELFKEDKNLKFVKMASPRALANKILEVLR